MWSLFVVPGDPGIEVSLQLLEAGVDAFAERHLIELLQDGFVEALADAVGLRASRLGAAVVDVLDGQIELVLMRLGGAAEFRAAVGQDAGGSCRVIPRSLRSKAIVNPGLKVF